MTSIAEPETTIALRDGAAVRVRAASPGDQAAIARLVAAASELVPEPDAAAAGRDAPDEVLALVATLGPDDRVVAHAACVARRGERAAASFAVADGFRGLGLGSALLARLAALAAERGVRIFEARVRPEGRAMLEAFRDAGFPFDVRVEADAIHLEFPTALGPEAVERFEEREWIAAANALRPFFVPRSVAVIGASRRRGTIGGEVFHNLLDYGFEGPVYPVNAAADVVQSVAAYPSVEAIPGPVDLAVIVVPAAQVLAAAEGCARKGVPALVVISAGFAETGPEGRARQDDLVRLARANGMRIVGPNCMGIINTDPAVRLNATFAPMVPESGRIAFMSQSGALGVAIMDYAGVLGLRMSSVVSVGNKADLSGNDYLRYWAQDEGTSLILLYLESFGNPRRFSRIARRVARTKPIVAVKSGRSAAGARATGSHTGALVAAADVTVDALFRDAGVIRTDRLEEMFDVAALLSSQPVPRGRRVAILTNAGGPGILCADACEAEGLEVVTLSPGTQAALRAMLAKEASVANPVDMIASATASQFREAIEIVGRDPAVDAVIVIFIPPLVTRPEDAAREIVEGARALGRATEGTKPVLTVFMQARGVPDALRGGGLGLPAYRFPEDAALALARVARYGEWLARPEEPPVRLDDVHREEAASIVAAALGRGAGWLDADEAARLLRCYGLPVVAQRVVAGADEAARAAEELGGRVALKAIAPGLVHKTEAGAVRLGLAAGEVREAALALTHRLAAAGRPPTGFLVQRMAEPGVEMIVGVVHDPQFGPVVACGAGGTVVELVKDVAIRLTPLSARGAEEMVRELRTHPLLAGYRGAPPADEGALVDIVLRVAAMVEDLPAIAELDLNPVLVHARGATIADARVRLAVLEDGPAGAAPG